MRTSYQAKPLSFSSWHSQFQTRCESPASSTWRWWRWRRWWWWLHTNPHMCGYECVCNRTIPHKTQANHYVVHIRVHRAQIRKASIHPSISMPNCEQIARTRRVNYMGSVCVFDAMYTAAAQTARVMVRVVMVHKNCISLPCGTSNGYILHTLYATETSTSQCGYRATVLFARARARV